jgi:predicted nucleotidyltransferase
MHLDTTVQQPEAVAFYRSLGYEEIGREQFPGWELIFFSRELRADKITTLNSGLRVGDVDLSVQQVRARDELLERLRAGMAADDRVEAVWTHGSLGRGDEDVLSDIDLIVVTARDAEASFVTSIAEIVARFGPVALANPMPANAPEGGYFLSVLYDVEPLPTICDWCVWPFTPTRPADVAVVYERDPSRFATGGNVDEIMSEVPRSTLFLDNAEVLKSSLYMVLPIAKDAVRGWTESVDVMREYLPFALPPVDSMAQVIDLLRHLVDEHASEEPPGAVAAVRRYVSRVERLLPTSPHQ